MSVYRGDELAGYVYLNSDVTSAVGYSETDPHLVIDMSGVVHGLKLVEHHEPIVLIGIPEEEVVASLNTLIGRDLGRVTAAQTAAASRYRQRRPVTVLVMGDGVVRSAVRLIRSNRLGLSSGEGQAATSVVTRELNAGEGETRDWQTLVGDGSVRSLQLAVGEVSDAFRQAGHAEAAERPETRNPQDRFIELYVAPVSVPTVGRSLLGDVQYDRLMDRLRPGQHAIVVAGDGAYSFKGSGYVRGGIFDRIELLQDGQGIRFRDRNHTRLGDLAAEGSPRLREIALFVVPDDFEFEVTEPWELQLLVQRSVGARDRRRFLRAGIHAAGSVRHDHGGSGCADDTATSGAGEDESILPESLQRQTAAGTEAAVVDEPLWQRIWKMNPVFIGITVAGLLVLTAIFFFQDWLVRRPILFGWVRRSYLVFTLFWLGWYANAQLSVVNV